ncbi:MAG: hypothetical protein QOG49_1274 [Frankiaceae bacterium]|jgi:hypothetical protein|nr:hypothetical protein [Frankiaceae bacterium]
MTTHVTALCFDANDSLLFSGFWAGFLGWTIGVLSLAVGGRYRYRRGGVRVL